MTTERRKEPRELPRVSDELQDLIDALPAEQQQLNRVFWRDISAYAIENAKRLDRAYAVMHKIFWVLAVAVVLIVVVLAVVGISTIVLLDKNSSETRQRLQAQRANTAALCALRGDLEARVQSSNDFLLKHPRGIPGITAATIRSTIVNEQRTITALSPIRCSRHRRHS